MSGELSELQEKLLRRRTVIEETGTEFVSTPQTTPTGSFHHDGEDLSAKLATPRTSVGPLIARASAGEANDFMSVINRQRARVDGDGHTFESKPAQTTADCGHGGAAGAGADCASGSNGHPSTGQRAAAAARLARGLSCDVRGSSGEQLDVEWETFESKPTATTADCSAASSGVCQTRTTLQPEQERGRFQGHREAHLQAAADVDTAQEDSEAKDDPAASTPAMASTPTPSRSRSPVAQQETEGDMEQLHPETDNGAEDNLQSTITLEHKLTVSGNRVSWLIALGAPPYPEVFESPEFAIGNYNSIFLRMKPILTDNGSSGGCQLSVHGPSPRPPGLKVLMFAGKGWANKRATKDWPDGVELTERFEVSLDGRTSLLCGIVY